MGRAFFIDGSGTAWKDEAARLNRLNLALRCIERKNLAIDAGLADAPRDQLSVLRTKVEYDYSFVTFSRQKRKPPRWIERQTCWLIERSDYRVEIQGSQIWSRKRLRIVHRLHRFQKPESRNFSPLFSICVICVICGLVLSRTG